MTSSMSGLDMSLETEHLILEIKVKDYRNYHYKITQEIVDETKSYIAQKKYRKPKEDLTLIEDKE